MYDASQKEKLLSIFKDIPKEKTNMQQLVETLEDKCAFTCYDNSSQCQVFCEAYTIKLIRKYVRREEEQQILLATYRLLKGYDDEAGVIARRERYVREASGSNKLIKKWGNPNSSLQKIENRIVETLVGRLTEIITDNPEKKGWLNLAEVVKKELSERFPDGLPQKLPLPFPLGYKAPQINPSITPDPLPPPVDPPDPPPLPKQNRFQIFLERAKKILSKYKVAIIAILIAFIAGVIVTYLTSPLWSGNGSNKDNDDDGPGWSDNGGMRPSYTINEVNAGALGNQIIFNTISDSVMGNEKNFVGAREYTGINAGENNVWEGNEIQVANGKEYVIRLYAHNNNRFGYDGVAENTRVSFSIPSTSSKEVEVNGFIMSSNATPSKYWDYVTFKSDHAFHLEYVPGSALLENNGIGNGGLQLSDTVVDAANGGTLIGYDALDGRVPGCYQYDNFITIRVKVVYDTAYTLETQVRLVGGDKTWGNSVEAKVGDKVEFRMAYKNNDTVDHLNVGIKNVLPDNLKYISGSTKLVNGTYPNGATIDQDDIVTRGINIGSYGAGANAFVRFQAEVVDESLAYGSNTLVSWGQAGVNKTNLEDHATVHVVKD